MALVAVGLVAALVAAEVAFRLAGSSLEADSDLVDRLQASARSRRTAFAPRAFFGWVHGPQNGQRGPEGFLGARPPKEKTPGRFRVSCLGASTTVRYPPHLERELSERVEGEVECINWGVHGWTTAETMVNYFLNVQDYDSDLVVLLHAWNDVPPRLREDLRSDYTHYRIPWKELDYGPLERFLLAHSRAYANLRAAGGETLAIERFTTRGGPTDLGALLRPETLQPFYRNVRTVLRHVESNGGRCVLVTLPCREYWLEWKDRPVSNRKLNILGSHQHNEYLRRIAREEGVLLVDLYAWARENAELLAPHYIDLIHLDQEGNALKARHIADELERAGLLPGAPR